MLARILSYIRKIRGRRRPLPADMVDVKKLLKSYTVEELCQRADEYYLKRESTDYLLAKPLIDADEAPHLLINFAKALQGLRIQPGIKVLDFAAGSCWTTRFLTQLGAKVIAMDVSKTALDIGKDLFARHKVIGERPTPEFMVYDGRKIDLPSASVDRILCMDAFHHVPNPADVLKEMARVLKEGGIACFVEPGADHSRSPQSQEEMKKYKVIEDDIVMQDIWAWASAAGFTGIEFSVYNADPYIVSLKEHETLRQYPGVGALRYYRKLRNEINSRNTFFLYKGVPEGGDSKNIKGLKAGLKVALGAARAGEGGAFSVRATLTNEGSSQWLPASVKVGGVNLGVHLLDERSAMIDLDYFRKAPPYENDRPIAPGESVTLSFDIPAPPKGIYVLEFDMVAENVNWFARNSSQTVRKRVRVESV
ncbi:hypothetical protein MNBD_NITROSPINAE02-489 [hydrothermal vent metagenome]|uniref:Methyltransferase type 11 domain-containing protein n=1 Tax=hydrothermal vent metagenome TaxID=652676 RepID=A0A3B1C8S3_9ZZZZ